MKAYVREVTGFIYAVESMRLSFGSKSNGADKAMSLGYSLNKDDHDLLLHLIQKGDSHSKTTRMIQVWLDLTLPRYIWAEWDTYKIGTTAMSESTVHTLSKEIASGTLTLDRFEYTDATREVTEQTMNNLYYCVRDGGMTVEELKQMLPESFLQRRIVNLNYQTLRHIYFDRRNHRLKSWHTLLDTLLEQLPFPEFITAEK